MKPEVWKKSLWNPQPTDWMPNKAFNTRGHIYFGMKTHSLQYQGPQVHIQAKTLVTPGTGSQTI